MSAAGGLGSKAWLVWLAVLAVLVAATGYETAVALGAIPIGRVPGEGPSGAGIVLAVALLALLVGAVLAPMQVARWYPLSGAVVALIAPAAAAFVTARFYTYDPYYAPTLRRMSEGGLFSPVWVFTLLGVALVAGAVTRIRPRAGLLLTAAVLLVSAFTALFAGGGH